MSVTAKGEADKADQVSFTCENEMLHKETASFEANDDYIVLDYGLPVEIDPLVNDWQSEAAKNWLKSTAIL